MEQESELTNDKVECEICCDMVLKQEMTNLTCGHTLCQQCLSTYMEEMICGRGRIFNINCPYGDCTSSHHAGSAMQFIDEEKTWTIFYSILVNTFVKDNESTGWCPSADCGKVVQSSDVQRDDLECPCHTFFCKKCDKFAHEGITCSLVKTWQHKIKTATTTHGQKYFEENTRECPSCTALVEKDGGCQHITCINCQHNYCWVCSKDWFRHGDMACTESVKKKPTPDINDSRISLHASQHGSLLMSYAERKSICSRLSSIKTMFESHKLWPIDLSFFEEATKTLLRCTNTLATTAIFLYYVQPESGLQFFEQTNIDLVSAAQKLHELLLTTTKSLINTKDLIEWCDVVRRQSRYCEQIRQLLVGEMNETRIKSLE